MRSWRQRHPDASRAIYQAYRVRTKLRVLSQYGGVPPRCACCGESEVNFLTLDHTNGDGAKERRSNPDMAKCGIYAYLSVIRRGFPDGYRVLCWNCNLAIGLFGKCPHAVALAAVR